MYQDSVSLFINLLLLLSANIYNEDKHLTFALLSICVLINLLCLKMIFEKWQKPEMLITH